MAQEPIKLPPNPMWEVFKRFGRDESTSGLVNVGFTALASPFLRGKNDGLLAAVGPVVEKVGLFYWYFKDAIEVYKTTPRKDRKNIMKYFGKAFYDGLPTLAEDLLVHDPIYATLLYTGLKTNPTTPTWMLSSLSFVLAVVAASAIEVGVKEGMYKGYKKKMKKAGFGFEDYLESRFFIRKDKDPMVVLEAIKDEFDLGDIGTWTYSDRYVNDEIPDFNGRGSYMRLRKRVNNSDDNDIMQSAQIVFRQTRQIGKREVAAHNYFLCKKEKLYTTFDGDMPLSIDDVDDEVVREKLELAHKGNWFHQKFGKMEHGTSYRDVLFERSYAKDEHLLASADSVRAQRPFNVIELKARTDVALLKEAMRYVMIEFPVLPTTYGKLAIANMNGNC